ncbi:MAG TPA: GAF domain-containing protein, partial [Bacteroidota bacterium]|nr:GAF domain-containing protein [Bacteroidota bacterium]
MTNNVSTPDSGEQQMASVREKAQTKAAATSDMVQRVSLLHEVALKIGAARSRDEILEVVRNEAKWLIQYQVCFLTSVNRAQSHFVVTTLSPVADATELNHKHFLIDEGMPGWVIKNQSAIMEGIKSGPAFCYSLEGKLLEIGIESLLIVPLRTMSEISGSIVFGSVGTGVYREEDRAIAQQLALVLASALRNASVVENSRKRMAQIELINKVSNQLTAMLNLDELMRVAASTIRRTFSYFDVTLFFLSPDKKELVLEAHSGNFVDFLPHDYRQPTGQGIVGWVAEHGERVLCNDVALDPRYMVYEYHNTKSELAIPIRIDNEVVGVLNVEDAKLHAFDETDAVVLETICDQFGTAIKNARLYEEIRKANTKLTEVNTMKSEFLGIVSHDFRSPLASIMLAGRSLLKNEVVQEMPRVKEYLQLMVNQASRLNRLAEDTLSITKLESGQLSYVFKIVNVERLIQDAVALVRFSGKHRFEYKI